MPRPQTDIVAGRKLLMHTVEELIRERGAVDISMAELAAAAGMSPANIYRFFENKEELLHAMAENWFAESAAIMEAVVASDLAPRDKLFAFFGRRFAGYMARFAADPEMFKSMCQLGSEHFEAIRGYVDLGDHFLAMIVAEAMHAGYFTGLTIDETVSLINQMVFCYCNPDMIVMLEGKLNEDKLSHIIDAIFAGLTKQGGGVTQQMNVHQIHT
jgi:AcrR family transcriptional regulator